MLTKGSLLQYIRWTALGILLAVLVGVGLVKTVAPQPATPHLSFAAINPHTLLADGDKGQETHGGKGGKG